jgi:hypothetical protein
VVLFTPFAHMKGKNFYITDKDCPKKGRWGDMPHTQHQGHPQTGVQLRA